MRSPATLDLVVVGLGYVGLPVAVRASEVGMSVAGLDLNSDIVRGLNASRSHVDDVSDDQLRAMVARGFRATSDPDVLRAAAAAVVCVPTPLSDEGAPDLSAVREAMRDIAERLHDGMLVILESTSYPGTTEEVVRPILEASGRQAGRDFHLAFSPERIDPGNPHFGLRNTPKIVGGCTEECSRAAAALYERLVEADVIVARGSREAELAKLLENTYRHVNIALMNEMVKFCKDLDIDLWDVIRCASTKPFGFQAFYPGPGVGGHCIPIDPNYLSYNVHSRLGYQFRFVELAQEINAGMPMYVLRRVQDLLNLDGKALNGSRVLLLGVTYKADVADTRETPARPLAEALRRAGAQVAFHDPLVPLFPLPSGDLTGEPDLQQALREADIAVLLQAHAQYLDLGALPEGSRLFDTRGVLKGSTVARL